MNETAKKAVDSEESTIDADVGNSQNPEETDGTSDDTFVVIFDDETDESTEVNSEICTSEASTDSADADGSFVIIFDDDDADVECQTHIDNDGNCSVLLPADTRVSNIDGIKDSLASTLDVKKVSIDASKVRYSDTSSIQLLRSYFIALEEMNIPVEWKANSTELEETAMRLGISFSD